MKRYKVRIIVGLGFGFYDLFIEASSKKEARKIAFKKASKSKAGTFSLGQVWEVK